MNTNLVKLHQLLVTGDLHNIKLALELAKSNEIDLQLHAFAQLYEWLKEHESIFESWEADTPPIAILLQRLFQLYEVDIEPLNVVKIPSLLGQLQQIEHLTIRRNKLNKIPPCVYDLPNLKFLSINSNPIESVASQISNLQKLTYLSLSSNKLAYIAPDILRLSQLTVLNMGGNQITTIPKEIGKLTKLERLILFGNPITDLSPLLELQQLNMLLVDFYKVPRAQLIALKRKFPALVFS